MRLLAGLVAVSMFGMNCGSEMALVEADGEASVDSALSFTPGRDESDRNCNVVLRELKRGDVRCTQGVCWYSFSGTMDVSAEALAAGGTARVLWRGGNETGFRSMAATAVAGAPAGMSRFSFVLTRNTVRDGLTATGLANASLQLMPFLVGPRGGRLFDHNRIPGEFDNYVVTQATGWAVATAPAVCAGPVLPTITFTAGLLTQQRGMPVAGQSVRINYAFERLDRLTSCQKTSNGVPALEVTGFAQLQPSGAVVSAFLPLSPGLPLYSVTPWVLPVPAGTTSMSVWFKIANPAQSCESFDSQFGANYVFNVLAQPLPPVAWVGNPGSSFNRLCERTDGVPAEVRLDDYVRTRACAFVTVDAWVPELTLSQGIIAEMELRLDGTELPVARMQFIERVGNNWRFRYDFEKTGALYYGPKWQRLEYTPRFSTDGQNFVREPTRALVRDISYCNPAWGGC